MSASSRPEAVDAARAGLHGVVDATAQHLEAAADTEDRPARQRVGGDRRRRGRAHATSAGRRRWPCCRGSPRRRRRPARRGRSPTARAPRVRRPAPRRRWSWRCAAAGSRPPSAIASPTAVAAGRRRGGPAPTPSPRRRATARRRTAPRRRWAGRSAASSWSSPGASSAGSPRNLLTTKPGDQRLVLRREHGDGAEQVGQQPAAVDVADHHDGQVAPRAPAPCWPDPLPAG